MCDLIGLQRLLVLQTAEDREIDRIVVRRLRRQCAREDELSGGDCIQTERIAERQLVLSERPGLVGAEHIHARQFLDRDQFAHNRLFLGEQARADRHRHRQDRRHRHGDGRDRQHERELQHGEDRLAAVDSKSDDHGHKDQREDNQVVADLQHGFLEMADGDRRLHQFRRLAKVGFAAGRVDQRIDFTATNDRPGEDRRRRICARRAWIPRSTPTGRQISRRRPASARRPARCRRGASGWRRQEQVHAPPD